MIKIYAIAKTNISEDWDIELINNPDIQSAAKELVSIMKNYGYLVSLFYVQSVLKIQFFDRQANRSIISVPKNSFEHNLSAVS
ncbi:MAG: hypothetical protein NWR97_00410 [Salibacteraceae bacterium]|jgi:hypothetical protein|nr:hypothetical protein [Salibacteraceae bacterium]